jgi:hypothetical protein
MQPVDPGQSLLSDLLLKNCIHMKKITTPLLIAMLLFSIAAIGQNRETRKVETFTKISFRVPGKLYVRQGSVQKVEIEGKKDVLQEIETEVEGSRLVIGKEGKWFDWDWDGDEKVNVYITVVNIEGLSDLIGETKLTAADLDLNVSGSGSMKVEVDASGELEADVSGSGDLEVKGKCRSFNSDVSGSGSVKLDAAIAQRADFGVSGSGKIYASGTSESVKTSISGSGKVLAANLETNRCEVRISGSGNVEINVKNELDANISGSGSISYKGNPGKVNSHASGSGSVSKM